MAPPKIVLYKNFIHNVMLLINSMSYNIKVFVHLIKHQYNAII